ncbi:protein phosphatase 1M isoform X2 [Lathamus discolor]|uniref:protein phosphatase 1M isoform X2 n=1 Tax=Lathamus discolor TaxID=678569 RepID=UPI0032B859F0
MGSGQSPAEPTPREGEPGPSSSAGAAYRGCRSGESWLRSARLRSVPFRSVPFRSVPLRLAASRAGNGSAGTAAASGAWSHRPRRLHRPGEEPPPPRRGEAGSALRRPLAELSGTTGGRPGPRHGRRVAAAAATGRPRGAARRNTGDWAGPSARRPQLPPAQVPAWWHRGEPAGPAGSAGYRARAAPALGDGLRRFLTGYYWALFDGHGGPEAAIIASNYLHYCIKQKLEEVVGGITEAQPPMHLSGRCVCDSDPQFVEEKHIHAQDLVVGALENAFQECDEVIGQEMEATNQTGGCTALAALYFQGKLYVANAGDSRAVLVLKDNVVPMSCEFTPETERQRIQHLAFLFPKLLGGEFTRFEFPRRLKGDDVGQKVLYRDYFMEGWGYKTVEKADLKYPLVHGHGKQARLLGTLAVSRGLGDHQLEVIDTNIEVKPFLSCIPKVKVFDFALHDIKEDDVLIMATDGLWDVLCNKEVAHMVRSFLEENRTDPHRFSKLAKCLVCRARGKKRGHQWMLDDNHEASYDDISVFVIPLHNRDEN